MLQPLIWTSPMVWQVRTHTVRLRISYTWQKDAQLSRGDDGNQERTAGRGVELTMRPLVALSKNVSFDVMLYLMKKKKTSESLRKDRQGANAVLYFVHCILLSNMYINKWKWWLVSADYFIFIRQQPNFQDPSTHHILIGKWINWY